MTYVRRFTIQAAHLNGASDYEKVKEADAAAAAGNFAREARLLREVLSTGLHGHNFELVFHFTGELDGSGYVVDDEQLAALVARFDNRNLSFVLAFAAFGRRATTEAFADVLAQMVMNQFPAVRGVRVQVYERPEIMAETEVSR